MAEVYHNNIIDIDLESGTLFRSFLNHTIGSGDNNANWYGVRVFRKGQPIALSGCSVQGLFMPASGSAILISDGTHTLVSGNEAAVLLPQACYNVKGQFTLAIKIIGTNSYSITDTVRIIDGVVADTYSANPVAPTAAVPTYQEILSVYDQMVAVKEGSVLFNSAQSLTEAQKTQARGNIAAASESDVSDLKSAFNKVTSATKNLFDIHDGTYVGVVVKRLDDGGISIVGTAESNYNLMKFLDEPFYGDYALSVKSTQSFSTGQLNIVVRKNRYTWLNGINVIGNSGTLVASTDQANPITTTDITLINGVTYNTVLHVQLEKGNKVTDFVPLITAVDYELRNCGIQKVEYATHAGVIQMPDLNIYQSSLMANNIKAVVSGGDGSYKIAIPAHSAYTGLAYATCGFSVKDYIKNGNTIKIALLKSNTTSAWNWDAIRLSNSYTQWAPGNLIMLLKQSPGNVEKAEYEIDFSTLDINPDDYETIYLVIDTFFNNPPVQSSAVELSANIKIYSGESVVATDLVGFIPDNYYTKGQVDELIRSGIATVEMAFWGDSLTAGAGGNGTTYPAICAALLGKRYSNCGIGGETEQTIAARQGGNNLMIPAGAVNGQYSFSQMLDGNGKQILPLRQGGSNMVNPVIINGQSCTLSLSNETYTISGYNGTLLFETPALFNGNSIIGDITVIWVGTNGLGSNTVDERISYIKSMLTRAGKKYVVMGISVGTNENRAEDDAAMRAAFGNHFFPTRKMLVNNGLNVIGITPTSQDTTDISNGTVPTSLRSDGTHLNANGYTAVGRMLAAFIVGLGYASYAQ